MSASRPSTSLSDWFSFRLTYVRPISAALRAISAAPRKVIRYSWVINALIKGTMQLEPKANALIKFLSKLETL